jgi:hypothetical protein
MFKKGFYSHIGANKPIVAGTINLGSTKGRGSSTRMFNYCNQHSANPSECINQFITVAQTPTPPPPPTPTILVYNTTRGSSFVWGGVTFTLDTSLPNFSYTAITSSIPGFAPSRTNLTGVTIGNVVTTIGDSAFFNCSNLTSVTFTPISTLTSIGQNAFSGCTSLISIEIPDLVETIGSNAFNGSNNLESVTLPINPLFTSIADSTFNNCNSLISITIPDSITSIGQAAFFGCYPLTSITIPPSVTTIGDYAFQSCSGLISIIIPNSVTSIGELAFEDTGLTTVTISNAKAAALGTALGFTWTSTPSPGTSIPTPQFYGAPTVRFILP